MTLSNSISAFRAEAFMELIPRLIASELIRAWQLHPDKSSEDIERVMRHAIALDATAWASWLLQREPCLQNNAHAWMQETLQAKRLSVMNGCFKRHLQTCSPSQDELKWLNDWLNAPDFSGYTLLSTFPDHWVLPALALSDQTFKRNFRAPVRQCPFIFWALEHLEHTPFQRTDLFKDLRTLWNDLSHSDQSNTLDFLIAHMHLWPDADVQSLRQTFQSVSFFQARVEQDELSLLVDHQPPLLPALPLQSSIETLRRFFFTGLRLHSNPSNFNVPLIAESDLKVPRPLTLKKPWF